MKRNNQPGVRYPEALIGVNGPDEPHLGPPTLPMGQEHYLSSALGYYSLFEQCCRGADFWLPVHGPCWCPLWALCGPPGLVAQMCCCYGPVWQSLECVWSWPVNWPPSLASNLCHHHELARCWGLAVEVALLSLPATVGLAIILPSAPASLSCWKKTWISQGK